jgi:hypothetical protein
MADIYKHAYLPIAATCSRSSYDGFLNKRTSWEGNSNSPIYYELPSQEGWGENCAILLQSNHGFPSADAVTHDHRFQPLERRAWALQERIMSRRTLAYDSQQIFWECNTSRFLEGWTFDLALLLSPLDPVLSKMEDLKLNRRTIPRGQNILHVNPRNAQDHYTQWYKILRQYRSRKMTYLTDALPAISGIAKDFMSITGDKYLAGIW